ncbi:MAG: neutral zinc metallopeptidase [Thermomicrobiales bacterium]
MVRFLSRMTVLVMFLVLLGAPVASVHAQATLTEEETAAVEAAERILRLAVDRQFNALYEYIHPDAAAIIPRGAAIAAFEEIYGASNVGDATIVSIQMGPWTWGVTGKEYPRAAAIEFTQPFVNDDGRAETLEDTMYLVEDQGQFKWFFGSDPEFVQGVIDDYEAGGNALTQGELFIESGDFLQEVVNDLDAFFADVLSYTGITYYSPGVVLVVQGTSASSACGPAQSGFWGFYCPPDQTLYLEDVLLSGLIDQGLDFAAAFVIAHEWSHHVQTVLGFERTTRPETWNQVHSIELELMADCFSGAWARDAYERGRIDISDVDEAMNFTIQRLGDPTYIDEYDPQAHGTADQRVTAFMNGFEEGFSGCNIKI